MDEVSPVVFECPRCGFTTTTRAYLLKHIDKKIECPPNKENITNAEIKQRLGVRATKSYNRDTQTYDCNICHKGFQTASGKYKHLRTCRPLLQQRNDNSSIAPDDSMSMTCVESITLSDLERIVEERINKMAAATTNITNNTHNNTINVTNNHLIIQIRPFGQENMDYLVSENGSLKRILEERGAFFQNVVKEVHYNDEHPENMNIYISNVRGKHALIFNGQVFELKMKTEYLKRVMDSNKDLITNHYDRVGLDEPTKQYIKDKMEKLSHDKESQEKLLERLELMCYNHRDQVKAIHNTNPQTLSAQGEEEDEF